MESGWIWAAVLLALLVFGVTYNHVVAELEKRQMARGITALLVVGGTLACLVGLGFLAGWLAALAGLACFSAGGSPMLIGSLLRYQHQRRSDEAEAARMAREMLDDR